MSIVTFTPSPSFDVTAAVAVPLERGGVNRLDVPVTEAGGKGVNVARVVSFAGRRALAVIPADDDDPFLTLLSAAGLDYRNVPSGRPVRSNLAVTEPDGTTTKLNQPGFALAGDVLARVSAVLAELAAEARWVVLSGAFPAGTPAQWLADLIVTLKAAGVRVAVDTSDDMMIELGRHFPGAAPDLIKPNGLEIGQLTGSDGARIEEAASRGEYGLAVSAARQVVDSGVGAVLLTLGGSGAVLATGEGVVVAAAPDVPVASTVGAGDSALAGYLLADLADLDAAGRLRMAVGYGSAAAGLPGSGVPRPEQVHAEAVTTWTA